MMTEQQLQEMEAWFAEAACFADCDEHDEAALASLIAEVRRLQQEADKALVTHIEAIEQGNGLAQRLIAERDAALVERDALLVRVDQWRQMADREATAHVEMRAERDAARQEAAAAQAAWASDVAEWKEWLLGAEQARDGWKQRAEQAEAALTEARLVLRECRSVLVHADSDCSASGHGRAVTKAELLATSEMLREMTGRVDAVLAQDADA